MSGTFLSRLLYTFQDKAWRRGNFFTATAYSLNIRTLTTYLLLRRLFDRSKVNGFYERSRFKAKCYFHAPFCLHAAHLTLLSSYRF